jgi:hypothetical protein
MLSNGRVDNGWELATLCGGHDLTARAHQQDFVRVAEPMAGAGLVLAPNAVRLVGEPPFRQNLERLGSMGTVAQRNNTQSGALIEARSRFLISSSDDV